MRNQISDKNSFSGLVTKKQNLQNQKALRVYHKLFPVLQQGMSMIEKELF